MQYTTIMNADDLFLRKHKHGRIIFPLFVEFVVILAVAISYDYGNSAVLICFYIHLNLQPCFAIGDFIQ